MSRGESSLRGVMMRPAWLFLALLLALVGCSRPSVKPNVVLIVVDSLRADHLGCYGYNRNTTPNIDALAKEGVLFRNAISQAPWTLPSVGSIFASQYPSVLGVYDKPAPLDPRFPLLAELLKGSGYATAGVMSCTLLVPRAGFARGFDQYLDMTGYEQESITSSAVTEKAVSFLRQARQDPFFLFLHYFDPHYNYHLHPEYNYFPDYHGLIASGESILTIWDKRNQMTQNDVDGLVSFYDSEISYTDQYIGAVMSELKRRQLYDNTLVIVVGDHGEEFMERGWIGHTIDLYQQLLHVPLVIKPSRGPSPETRRGECTVPVGLIDIMPTVLKEAGLPLPKNLEGRSLDLAAPQKNVGRPIFSETFNPRVHLKKRTKPLALRSVMLDGHKLILDQLSGRAELYDLAQDPGERQPLPAQGSAEAARLGGTLSKWIAGVKAKENAEARQTEEQLFNEEQIRRLKSLGYL